MAAAALAVIFALPGSSARAGDVIVSTSVPVEVRLDGLPVVRTFGPSTVTLPEVSAGGHTFAVYRSGKATPVDVEVPESGSVRLMIGAESIETDAPVAVAPPEGAAPIVAFKASDGEPFTLVMDGQRTEVDGTTPLRLAGLSAGPHDVQVRSPDLTVVWVRGTLDLQAGDDLVVTMGHGRMVEVLGRPEAWRASGSSAAPDNRQAPAAAPEAPPQ